MATIIGTNNNDVIIGTPDPDLLLGLGGDNLGNPDDVITGAGGNDMFVFIGEELNEVPSLALVPGFLTANTADTITDFKIGEDQLALRTVDFNVDGPMTFANAKVADLTGAANVVVLQDAFPNGAVAAAAIRDNPNFYGVDEGYFVYFNQNLGFDRLVYSRDLDEGGDITVLANLPGNGLADLPNFTPNEITFVDYGF